MTGFAPSAAALALAFAIDRLFGELPAAVHPVVWMGRATDALMRVAPQRGPLRQLLFGALVALLVPAMSATLAWLVLFACRTSALRIPVEAVLLSSLFAVRALGDAARGLQVPLEAQQLPAAREALRSLCSRDAAQLEPPELAAAAIESTAENASDSIVAPLFFYALLGLPGAAAYRAVNTLDAMIGYRGRFEWLGKIAARLDDALNLVPARLTAGLLLLAGALRGVRVREGMRVWWRDARNTESPNAGHPMAAMAGMLGVRLEKRGCYALGDATRALEPADVARAWRVVSAAAWIALGLALLASLERSHGLV
jgi:adenosylcobinamide-phosphate synthase